MESLKNKESIIKSICDLYSSKVKFSYSRLKSVKVKVSLSKAVSVRTFDLFS
jgi:hypothetical protein